MKRTQRDISQDYRYWFHQYAAGCLLLDDAGNPTYTTKHPALLQARLFTTVATPLRLWQTASDDADDINWHPEAAAAVGWKVILGDGTRDGQQWHVRGEASPDLENRLLAGTPAKAGDQFSEPSLRHQVVADYPKQDIRFQRVLCWLPAPYAGGCYLNQENVGAPAARTTSVVLRHPTSARFHHGNSITSHWNEKVPL